MIVIIDCGMGNPGSILNMIRKLGKEVCITNDAKKILSATHILFPGVGSFDNGIKKLSSSGMLPNIEKRVLQDKIPFLGICLGMQLLFSTSEEGVSSGLCWLPGKVTRFNFNSDRALKIPHMGWNSVRPTSYGSLFNGLEEEARFYFVHSYYVECDNHEHILGYTNYGISFASTVQYQNIYGVQFHPEKSHRFGLTLLKNFLRLS